MAGKPGKSGGARKGAGRPKGSRSRKSNTATPPKDGTEQPRPIEDGQVREPLAFLELVMNDPQAPLKDRIRAGIAAAQYRHTKRHDGGKKEETVGKAGKAAKGRFGTRPAPLKLVGGA